MDVVHRIPISDLEVGMHYALVVGVIIAKSESKKVTIRKSLGSEDEKDRLVIQLTIRDSPEDTINMAVWINKPDLAAELDRDYHIGDVVEISNPKVQLSSPSNERYAPFTSSRFSLSYSASQTKLCKLDLSPDAKFRYKKLMSYPTKNASNFFTVSDINDNPRLRMGANIDILAAIAKVSKIRTFTNREGQEKVVREIHLFDQTGKNLRLKLWDYDWVHMADQWPWVPFQDILFLSDVRVDHDTFWNCKAVTATSKTIITVNPDSEEFELLKDYARSVPAENILGRSLVSTLDYRTITKVTSIVTLQDSISNTPPASSGGDTGTLYSGIVYGYITRLDLDSDNVVIRRCKTCRKSVSFSTSSCPNEKCERYGNELDFVDNFNVRIDVCDFTGSLNNCRVNDDVAENLLCPLNHFQKLSMEEKTAMKWNICMQYAKIWVSVKNVKFDAGDQFFMVTIHNWLRISLKEFSVSAPLPPVQ